MEFRNEKYRQQIEDERQRLLSLSRSEIDKLSDSDKYQRMRFEREIEGNEYVFLLNNGYLRDEVATQARKNADRIVSNWNTAHGNV